MKTRIKDLPRSQKEIVVEISAEEMGKYVDEAAEKLSRTHQFDGFRQGKVPKDVVVRHFGEQKIFEEASQIAVEKSYFKIVKENNLSPIGCPRAEIIKLAPSNPFEYKVVVSVMPEVELGDYGDILGKLEIKDIRDEEVEQEIKTLQKKRARYITKDEPAQKGDRVEIDFESRIGGVKVEGGESRNHPLIVGEGNFIPGFEDNLVGMKKGEIKEFDLTFPDNYHKKSLAGKSTHFKVKMKIVQKVELPDINDDFARSLGKFEDLESLKRSIKEGMYKEEEIRAREKLRNDLIDQVCEKASIDIPGILVESELDNMINEFKNNISQTGIVFEDYLKNVNTDVKKLREEWKCVAEKRVKSGLVMREISIREKIEVSDDEIEEEVNRVLRHYPNEEEVRKNVDIEKFKDYIAGTIMNEKVFEALEKIAEKNSK
jgi:trigger factor